MPEKEAEQVISEEPKKLQGKGKASEEPSGEKLILTALTTLGVVFGDIGTSPLYAVRECFLGRTPIPPTPLNILGVLSLIFWSLVLVISIKYLLYVMRADNEGEGGILALMALLSAWRKSHGRTWSLAIALGVFGAALLYGDGMITPAISVLSAVEGLKVATPGLDPYVVPLTAFILVLLFVFQRRGTAGVGSVFGPVMLLWFAALWVLGIGGIAREPHVLAAVNPLFAVRFFLDNHWRGFLVLGAVFLVVTGGEALYADMGHFTRRTIRFAWFTLVLPGLLLNYFGQGGLLLSSPQAVTQPFYFLAPRWALPFLIFLATIATVIASQAVITGVFSLTRQAALLGFFPHVRIIQTSVEHIGQIYIPSMNWILMAATLSLVLVFRHSSGLAAAYGVAVSTTMVITTILAYGVARERWGWSRPTAILLMIGFLIVDLGFFGSNIFRIVEGGWVPLLVGGFVFFWMATWKRGRTLLKQRLEKDMMPLPIFVRKIAEEPPFRAPGTAVFMSADPKGTPPMLLRHLKLNQVLHERVILLTVAIEDIPRIRSTNRMEIMKRDQGITQVILHYGFMEIPNVPKALQRSQQLGFDFNPEEASYYVETQTLIPDHVKPRMALWREKLFAFMLRNSAHAVAIYGIPPERVIELGMQVEL
jgi:KUP system potassium uptake protein